MFQEKESTLTSNTASMKQQLPAFPVEAKPQSQSWGFEGHMQVEQTRKQLNVAPSVTRQSTAEGGPSMTLVPELNYTGMQLADE